MNDNARFRRGETMNPAKRYLLEYLPLRKRRDALLDELDRTQEASLRATSRLTATRLSGTSGHGGFENNAIRYVDCEEVLKKHIDRIGRYLEERLDILEENMRRMGMNEEAYRWYADLRRYGTVPHAGFGAGFERLLMFITGVTNIRDVLPFARTPRNCEF